MMGLKRAGHVRSKSLNVSDQVCPVRRRCLACRQGLNNISMRRQYFSQISLRSSRLGNHGPIGTGTNLFSGDRILR